MLHAISPSAHGALRPSPMPSLDRSPPSCYPGGVWIDRSYEDGGAALLVRIPPDDWSARFQDVAALEWLRQRLGMPRSGTTVQMGHRHVWHSAVRMTKVPAMCLETNGPVLLDCQPSTVFSMPSVPGRPWPLQLRRTQLELARKTLFSVPVLGKSLPGKLAAFPVDQ